MILSWHSCRAYPIKEYPAKCTQAATIMHMMMNNLDHRVAQVTIMDDGVVMIECTCI